MVANSTGSLPRNLAATLQDIEMKRQLALQQKGIHTFFYTAVSLFYFLYSVILYYIDALQEETLNVFPVRELSSAFG